MTIAETPKPCPFCGAAMVLMDDGGWEHPRETCFMAGYGALGRAVADWNRRAEPQDSRVSVSGPASILTAENYRLGSGMFGIETDTGRAKMNPSAHPRPWRDLPYLVSEPSAIVTNHNGEPNRRHYEPTTARPEDFVWPKGNEGGWSKPAPTKTLRDEFAMAALANTPTLFTVEQQVAHAYRIADAMLAARNASDT